MIQYSTTRKYIGTRQILLSHLSANEYSTITSPNHYLPQLQLQHNRKRKHHQKWRDVDMYDGIIDMIPCNCIEHRVGDVYENNWSC